MNVIIDTIENTVVSFLYTVREWLTPFFNKYTSYLKYTDYIIYGTYTILLLGFYNTLPDYIPILRNILLYLAVTILILRFNTISWNNPKFAILGGSKFSEVDRRLIMNMCFFIIITHVVSEKVMQYTKQQISYNITRPVRKVTSKVVNPIQKYIGYDADVNGM